MMQDITRCSKIDPMSEAVIIYNCPWSTFPWSTFLFSAFLDFDLGASTICLFPTVRWRWRWKSFKTSYIPHLIYSVRLTLIACWVRMLLLLCLPSFLFFSFFVMLMMKYSSPPFPGPELLSPEPEPWSRVSTSHPDSRNFILQCWSK